jgi:hypothetical protein
VEVALPRFCRLLLAVLFLSPAVWAKEEDTGVEPGLNIDFSGGKSLNKIGSALSYTYPFGGGFTFRLTLDQNVQNEPQANRESDSRTLRFDIFYEPVQDARIGTYYEQTDYDSNMETQDQYQISTSHRAGTNANVKFSDAFTADLNAYFTLSSAQEGTFDWDYGFREYVYDSLSANTDLRFDYQLTDKTRLSLDLNGLREVRGYPTQPALNSEYYVGAMNGSVTGNYALWNSTSLELRYLFNGTVYRDIDLIERNQDTLYNTLSLIANYETPFDVKAILSTDLTHGMTTYLEKEYYLQKYYYRIYPELDPIPGYRSYTPWWPLYDILTRGLSWKLQLNWDSAREDYLHWTLSQDTANKRYYDDEGVLPPERFAIADSVLTNIKNTMSTDAQINLGKSFLLKLQHKVTHDDFSYPISTEKETISLYNDVSSNIKWKLTQAVSFNANCNIGFDRTVGGISSSLPRRNDIKLSFGSEVKLSEGLRVGLTYTLSRNNSRTDDFQSGTDTLARELVVEPVLSVSDYWGLDFHGSFKEQVKFPWGEEGQGTTGLSHYWKINTRLNIYPTDTLSFELDYKYDSSISIYTTVETRRITHVWGLSFSYNIVEDLVVNVNADYRLYEYEPDRDSFNVGLRIRTNL